MSCTTTVSRAAHVLAVHRRTIIRAVRRDQRAPFIQAYDPPLALKAVARAFRCDATLLRRALAGRDALLDLGEAAVAAGIRARTFRYRASRHAAWRPDARSGAVIRRWSRNRIAALAARWRFNRPNGGRL